MNMGAPRYTTAAAWGMKTQMEIGNTNTAFTTPPPPPPPQSLTPPPIPTPQSQSQLPALPPIVLYHPTNTTPWLTIITLATLLISLGTWKTSTWPALTLSPHLLTHPINTPYQHPTP